MNKTALIKRVSERMSITQVEARRFVDLFEAVCIEALKEDKSLVLHGFGSFVLWQQTEREVRNPLTGESYTIRPRLSVKFRPGKSLLEDLNPLE